MPEERRQDNNGGGALKPKVYWTTTELEKVAQTAANYKLTNQKANLVGLIRGSTSDLNEVSDLCCAMGLEPCFRLERIARAAPAGGVMAPETVGPAPADNQSEGADPERGRPQTLVSNTEGLSHE